MKVQRNLAVVLSLLALIGLVGCNRNPSSAMADKPHDQVASTTGSAATGQPGNGNGSSAMADKAPDQVASTTDSATAEPSGGATQSGDAGITSKVKAAFIGELGARSAQIQVETIGGTVILNGTVDSQARSDLAQQVAAAVPGVKSIDNRLTVKSEGAG